MSPDKMTGSELQRPGYFTKEELNSINSYRSNHKANGYTLTTIYPPEALKESEKELKDAECMR